MKLVRFDGVVAEVVAVIVDAVVVVVAVVVIVVAVVVAAAHPTLIQAGSFENIKSRSVNQKLSLL